MPAKTHMVFAHCSLLDHHNVVMWSLDWMMQVSLGLVTYIDGLFTHRHKVLTTESLVLKVGALIFP